ncbi:MAG TPA: DinB family protein [Bryobacteraceae bacterium]|nr:DinB family protein [Bryobacteraceae bacterium]
MSLAAELSALYTRDLTRLMQEIAAFPTTESLWQTAPGISNSAGNLALHLEGNLREFIGRKIGGVAYTRERPLEFSSTGLSGQELAGRLADLRAMIVTVLGALEPADLDALYPDAPLGRPQTVRGFVLHLLTHLNYHLGQIDYLRRFATGDGAIDLAGL